MNATQIGQKLGGLKAKTINRIMSEANLQYKDDTGWRITEFGATYGEEMPFTRNGHSGYQIRWTNKVINYLKEWCDR